MRKTTEALIEEFYEDIKDKYPHLSLEQIKPMCKTQFEMVALEIQSGEMRSIRLKYFGNFVVYPGRVKALRKHLEERKEKGTVSFSEYDRLMTMYENYENNNK